MNVLLICFSIRFFDLDQNSLRNADVADYFTKKKTSGNPLKSNNVNFVEKICEQNL